MCIGSLLCALSPYALIFVASLNALCRRPAAAPPPRAVHHLPTQKKHKNKDRRVHPRQVQRLARLLRRLRRLGQGARARGRDARRGRPVRRPAAGGVVLAVVCLLWALRSLLLMMFRQGEFSQKAAPSLTPKTNNNTQLLAAGNGHVAVMNFLLDQGASVEQRNVVCGLLLLLMFVSSSCVVGYRTNTHSTSPTHTNKNSNKTTDGRDAAGAFVCVNFADEFVRGGGGALSAPSTQACSPPPPTQKNQRCAPRTTATSPPCSCCSRAAPTSRPPTWCVLFVCVCGR